MSAFLIGNALGLTGGDCSRFCDGEFGSVIAKMEGITWLACRYLYAN